MGTMLSKVDLSLKRDISKAIYIKCSSFEIWSFSDHFLSILSLFCDCVAELIFQFKKLDSLKK